MEPYLLAAIGWLFGVVINRAADNLPAKISLFAAPRCTYCDSPRSALDQIAVLSYLLWRGKCANCHAPIPLRAPLVEIANALAFAFLWTRDGATAFLALDSIYTVVLLVVLVIDLEHRLILNVVILPSILLAALASPLSRSGLTPSLLGGAVAFIVVLGIYFFGELFSRIRHISVPGGAFGQGDVTLATFVGLITAFPSVFNALVIAILLGGIGAIGFITYHLIAHRRLALDAVIPYGPFFCLAGWAVMVFG